MKGGSGDYPGVGVKVTRSKVGPSGMCSWWGTTAQPSVSSAVVRRRGLDSKPGGTGSPCLWNRFNPGLGEMLPCVLGILILAGISIY